MAVNFIQVEEIKSKIKNDGVQIVNFFATWCGPCKMIAPVLEEVSKNYEVYKIDIDKNKGVLANEGISGVPHTRIYKDGKMAKKIAGYVPVEKINEAIAGV